MNPELLFDLKLEEYQHPLDAKALHALQNTRGFEKVVKKFYDMGVEKVIKLQYTGSSLKLTGYQFEKINELVNLAAEVLNMEEKPDLYVQRSEELETITLGVDHPIIVLSSECVDKLSSEELLFLIGREMGHIKSNHILFQEIGFIFPELIEAFSYVTLGLSNIISAGLRYAFFHWAQMSQYTADRAGLLACQDSQIAKKMFSKWAGLPEKHWGSYDIGELENQARNFKGLNEKTFDKVMRFIYGNNLWAIARAHEIMKWLESGEYNRLLVNKTRRKNLY